VNNDFRNAEVKIIWKDCFMDTFLLKAAFGQFVFKALYSGQTPRFHNLTRPILSLASRKQMISIFKLFERDILKKRSMAPHSQTIIR